MKGPVLIFSVQVFDEYLTSGGLKAGCRGVSIILCLLSLSLLCVFVFMFMYEGVHVSCGGQRSILTHFHFKTGRQVSVTTYAGLRACRFLVIFLSLPPISPQDL